MPRHQSGRIRNAGWYNTDRLTAFGENAAGQRWELSDVGHVVHYGEETVEWNWTQVHPGTPGSRIVIAYYPWSASQTGRLELSVPLYDATPTLTLDATPAPSSAPGAGGPMAIQVEAGTPVIFTPGSPGSLIEDESWEWIPADTTQVAGMPDACGPNLNVCQTPVSQDGTMRVTARVDGQVRTATAVVGIAPPRLIVECDNTVERGSQVVCTARVEPAQAFRFLKWTGFGEGFGVDQEVNASRDALHVEGWGGVVVADTRVIAEAELVTGELLMGSSSFSVSDRVWTAPLIEPGAPQYTVVGPILDYPNPNIHNAFGAFFLGEPSPPGKTITDGGPNDSLSYIDQRPELIGTGIAIYPGLIGPPYSNPLKMWDRWHADQDTQAGSCGPADVQQLRTNVERHEGVTRAPAPSSHWGIATAEFASNNPYILIESIYSTISRDDLRRLVLNAWTGYANAGAYKQAQDNFDVIDTPLVYSTGINCVFDYNLRDP